MASSSIDVSLRLRNAKRFQQDASKSGKSVGDIGKGAKKADRDLGKLEKRTGKLRKGFSGLSKGAKLGIGAIGGAAALGAAKQAVGATQDLTKTTLGLQRATKMDNTTAVRWAAQAKVRGIDAKALNQTMGIMSKNVGMATDQWGKHEGAIRDLGSSQADQKKKAELMEGGLGRQATMFQRLGISHQEVIASGGDMSKLLPKMADGFKKLGPSQQRTEAMMSLMGRGWQTLTPFMAEGSKAMNEQLKMADKYGVTLGDKPIKSQKDMLALQREMKMAQLGWQVQFSTQVAPRLIKAFRFILQTSQKLKGVFAFADKHPGLVKAIAGLALLSATMRRVPGGMWLSGHILRGLGGIGGKLVGRLGGPVRNALMSVLGRSGTAAGATAAENIVNSTGSQFGRKSPKLNSRFKGSFRGFGGVAGKAFGVAAVLAIGYEVGTWLGKQKWIQDVAHSLGIKTGGTKTGRGGGPAGPGYTHSGIPRRRSGRDPIGARQHGGALRAGMSAVVGETRPEVITARPSGGFIRQLTAPAMRVPQLAGASAGAGGAGVEESVTRDPILMDGRVVAELIERRTRQKRARS